MHAYHAASYPASLSLSLNQWDKQMQEQIQFSAEDIKGETREGMLPLF
jgi:hypothetical protein